MATFTDFLSTFHPDKGRRGRQFEHFVKWFLKNDPKWATQVDQVWLWSEYPESWGRDKGIDLVFKDQNGRTWAVQAKCYSPEHEITKADVDKFLSESNRSHIDHRLLIATTDGLGTNGREVLDGQEKPVVRFLLNDFESSAVEYPDNIEHLAFAKRKPQPTPRAHQIEAIDQIVSGFRGSDRGQVVMACGTGKTFVCLWVKERLRAKRTIVLLPSLGLLSQTLSEWTYAARETFAALCVCSDQTVGRRDTDEAIGLASELPFPVTSDASEIAEFLRQDREQVIFSTYQSSPLIALAQSEPDVPRFDLAVGDEAHRCVGRTDAAFSAILDDNQIKADRRLFATATPRVYKASLKRAAGDVGVEVVDMSDPKHFGIRFHTLSFGEAIRRDLLTDYRVLIIGVDDDRIAEWIKTRRIITTESSQTTDAQSLAAQIGLLKSIKDWGLRRLISFHGRVKRAKEFSEDIIQVNSWLDETHRPSATLWADYVSGEMATITRKRKLLRLKALNTGEVGLLTNARCLSEGVDVPSLDGVAFIDPRSSEIDIIQSVGRAIRLSDNKTMGTIVIPVFIEQDDDAKEALDSSNFKPIWEVLEALKSHDERLSDELDQLRIGLGEKRSRTISEDDLAKIVFDLPTKTNETFANSLRVHIVEQTTTSWMFWYGLLLQFTVEHGHCLVPAKFTTTDGFKLGLWVFNQRQRRASLSPDRLKRLDTLGFDWDPISSQWEGGYSRLESFKENHGHCRVPHGFATEDGFNLAAWVSHQRNSRHKLSPDRMNRLDSLGFDWDPHLSKWEDGYSHLESYKKSEGHCRVPQSFTNKSNFKLGIWVGTQRSNRDRLSPDRVKRLDALGFDWDTKSSQWEEGYSHLEAFKNSRGHCRVPRQYTTEDGFKLDLWVLNQRHRRELISPDRVKRLDALGFDWDPISSQWEEGYCHLEAYKRSQGHSRVPQTFTTEDKFKLGAWVARQRTNKDGISPDRVKRLDALGFEWDPISSQWEEGYSHLEAFKKSHGHCRVSAKFATDSKFNLGSWVGTQRTKRDKLSPDRVRRLDALGFEWDPHLSQWEEGYSHLEAYKKSHGHCRVPGSFTTNGNFNLGIWVGNQRRKRDKLSPDRVRRLDALGFEWDPHLSQWEEGYSHLETYKKSHGHCRVPESFTTNGNFNLGIWVGNQRRKHDELTEDRRQRLNRLGFVWKVR